VVIAYVKRLVPGRDTDDNEITTWSVPALIVVSGAHPGPSAELASMVTSGRDVQRVEWTLQVPPGTQVGPRDMVTWQGVDYQVDGEPRDWASFSPFGPNPFAMLEVALRRVTG